jgi:hypothetical protein
LAVRIVLLASSILLSSALPAACKGSIPHRDDPWDHIDDLPSEVRQHIAGICKGHSGAQHDFAIYSPREKRWRINLEYLRSSGLREFRRGNQCLDADFVGWDRIFVLAQNITESAASELKDIPRESTRSGCLRVPLS